MTLNIFFISLLLVVPILIKTKLLIKYKLYISPATRMCLFHLGKHIDARDDIAETEENLMDFNADHTNCIIYS